VRPSYSGRGEASRLRNFSSRGKLYAYSAYESEGKVDRDNSSSSTSWPYCRTLRIVPASNFEPVGLYVSPPDQSQFSSVSVRSILKRRFIRSLSLWRDTSEMASLPILPVEDGRVCSDSVLFVYTLCQPCPRFPIHLYTHVHVCLMWKGK